MACFCINPRCIIFKQKEQHCDCASGTIYPCTSLLHLHCLSYGHASRLKTDLFTISYPSP